MKKTIDTKGEQNQKSDRKSLKTIITYMIILTLIMSIATACSKAKEPIRLGTMPTYSAAIYAVGIEKGFFKEAGVDVELTVFKSALDRDAAASAGELDGFMTDIMGAINLNAKGFPFTMTSREYEDFGVMAGSDKDISQIAIPSIGLSENTVVEYIVDTYLKKSVEKVNMIALPDRMGALLGGKLDYGVFPQPFMGIIKSKGGQIIVSTAAEDFHPVVLVFDSAYLKKQEMSVKAFYEGYMKTIAYMQTTDYADYKEALVTHGLATSETVDLYRLPVASYGLHAVEEKTYDAIKAWMLDKQLLTGDVKYLDVQSAKFVE